MGYGFIGKHRKTDEESIFYEECMYAYQPVFKECFGREIAEFSGRVTKNKKIILDIPEGIDHGQYLQKRGFGNAGVNGGPYGDLLIGIRIKPHLIFKRKNADVYCDVPISFAEAALGGEIEVPTIHGKTEFKIPEGTQTGTKFTIKGKGIKRMLGKGDHIFTVIIDVPKNLSSKQKDLLRQFAEVDEGNNRNKESFAEKLKKIFK